MASLLNGQYAHEHPALADPPSGASAQARRAHDVIESGAVLGYLRDRGYVVVSIPSSVTTTDVLTAVDLRAAGHLSSFEISLVTSSLMGWIAPEMTVGFLARDSRERALDQLQALAEAAEEDGDHPEFVVAHLLPPHPPFVLGGDPDYLHVCFPGCRFWATTLEETWMNEADYAARVRLQVDELNARVVETLDRVIDADPTGVVVVMSDHGARHRIENIDEHFRVLFAARTPGQPDLFGDDVTLVNVFRRILSEYFGESLPDLPYEAWESEWFVPLDISRYR
jgi:hypothetical protein